MQSSSQCRAGHVTLLRTLSLLSLLCGAAAVGPRPDTWRSYYEPLSDGGGATVAGGRTSDQQLKDQRDQQRPADGPAACQQTLRGKHLSEENQALEEILTQAHDVDYSVIENITHHRLKRESAQPRHQRCSCRDYESRRRDYQATLTIAAWATLALVAWYTPIIGADAGTFTIGRLNSDADWNDVYRQLRQGVARWSDSLSEPAAPSPSRSASQLHTAGSSGDDEGRHQVTDRRRRSPARRSPAAPRGGGATQRPRRTGSKPHRTSSTAVLGRLTRALRRWSLPKLRSSSGSRQRSPGTRYRDDEHHYPDEHSRGGGHHSKGCRCGGRRRQDRKLDPLSYMLHNSLWVPVFGLTLLVYEEVFWSDGDNLTTDNTGVTGRS